MDAKPWARYRHWAGVWMRPGSLQASRVLTQLPGHPPFQSAAWGGRGRSVLFSAVPPPESKMALRLVHMLLPTLPVLPRGGEAGSERRRAALWRQRWAGPS